MFVKSIKRFIFIWFLQHVFINVLLIELLLKFLFKIPSLKIQFSIYIWYFFQIETLTA